MAIVNLGVLGTRRMGAFGSVDPNLKAKLRAVRQTKKDFRLLSLFILVITIFLAFDCLAAPASKELNYEIRSSDGTANKIRQRRAATARLDRLWDDAVIPYEIDPIFSEDRSALFRSAMRHWENYTCIKFVERNQDEHRDYIVFTERSCGCCSFVGKRGNGAQAISIGKHCDKFGIVVHELGHVVGFWHEHTRPDRDQHVQIIGKNIMTGQEYNFNKLTRDEVNSLGLAYDYDSILHYATNTFAKDTYLDTILPLHGHLNTEEVMNHQRESANQNHQPASATAVNATSAPSTAFTNNSTATGTSQQASPKQNQTNPHMINDESRLKRIEMVRKSIEEDFHSMLQYAGVPAVKRNNSGSKRLQAREDDRVLLLDGGIVVSLAKGSAATLDKSNQPSEKSRRFARHASPVDIDDGQLMLSTDNVLAKVRPEIGQRVRLSVGDIAQTNLLYKCPKCGRTIQQLGGMFHSPNYHSNSNQDHQKLDGHGDLRGHHDESCEWRLTVGIGERIMITIADLDMAHPVDDAPSSAGLSPTSKMGLPRGELTQTELRDLNNQQRATSGPPAEADAMIMTDCHRDFVEIRDGYTYRAPVIARLCGHISRLRDTNRPIVSTSNRLIVSYHTSSKSIGKRGFLAHHETICGGFILLGNAPYDTDTTASALVSGSRAQSSGSSSSSTAKSHNGQASTTTTSNRQDSFRLNGSSVDVTSVRNATNGTSPSENEVLLSSQTTARSGLQAHQAVNASASHQHKSITDSPAATAHSNLMKISATTTTTTSTASVVPDSLAFSWDTWPMLNTTIIQSPNWPEQYRASRECLWQIRAEDNYQIALRFETFDLEPHDSCAYDYVEVRDGETTSSELLGRFCGNRVPSQVLSSGSNMLVKFVSDSDVNKPGFFASVQPEIDECKLGTHGCSYKCSNAAIPYRCECPSGLELAQDGKSCIPTCGGLRNDSSGQITSPSFPDLYPISTRCVWEIRAPLNHRITLNFTHFELEGIRTQECDYDYVEIWSRASDGKSSKNGIYCGLNQAFSVTSIANSMRIEFVSDNSIQKSGFEANYFIDRDECSSNNGGCQQICKNTIGSYQCLCNNGFVLHENNHDCIGSQFLQTITSPDGSIHSPNFPNLYQPNKEYAWLFSTAPSHRIKLIFDQFDLESHQECAYDHVAVFDGEGVDDHALGRFCGSRRPLTLASSFNKLYLVFRSDATNEKRGFNATHTTICGGRLQANVNHHDQIYSHPLFDGSTHYNRNEDCEWIIEANENQRVRIEFTFFALEADGNCNYDQISVYDGSDDAASQLARLCGADIPKEQLRITSSGESMLIVFKSDDSINGKGFSLTYTAVEVNEDETLAITYVTESKFTQPT